MRMNAQVYNRTCIHGSVFFFFFSHSKVDLDVKIRWSRCKSHFAHCQMLHRVLRTRYQVVPRCVFPCGQAATLLSRFFVTCSTVYAGLVLTLCDCVVELVMQFHYRGEVPQFVPWTELNWLPCAVWGLVLALCDRRFWGGHSALLARLKKNVSCLVLACINQYLHTELICWAWLLVILLNCAER